VIITTAGCISNVQSDAANENSIPKGMTFSFKPNGTEYDQFIDLGHYLIFLKENKNLVHRHFVWVSPQSLSNYLRMKVSLFPLPNHFIQQSN